MTLSSLVKGMAQMRAFNMSNNAFDDEGLSTLVAYPLAKCKVLRDVIYHVEWYGHTKRMACIIKLDWWSKLQPRITLF